MFDDVLSAILLTGVASVLAMAAASLGAGAPANESPRLGKAAEPTVARAPAAASMPVYDLPRVVVTGNRVRDGDILADNGDLARARGGPR